MAKGNDAQTGGSENVMQNTHQRLRGVMIEVGLLILLLVAACTSGPRPTAAPANVAQPTAAQPSAAQPADGSLTDDPTLGPANAPVTIIEYADFGCPTCREWHKAGILNIVLAKYGDKIRFVWHDFAVITPQSRGAAEAARCAYDQSKFWEYHDMLYDHSPALSKSDLKAYSAQLGLDTAKFNQCLDTEQHFEQVARGLRDGMDHGFTGTPSFLINDQPLAGAPSPQYLESKIDPILASKG